MYEWVGWLKMNITRLAIFVAIFIYTALFMNDLRANELTRASMDKTRYTDLINRTIEDTTFTMMQSSTYENGVYIIDKDNCLNTFRRTISNNMNYGTNDIYYSKFLNHVPLILFIDGDGITSYAMTSTGDTLQHILHQKKVFYIFYTCRQHDSKLYFR